MTTRNRVIILATVVVAFLAIGGYLISRSIGGGGRPVAIDLVVSGTTMTPSNPSAKAGDKVTMTITADKQEEVHLHGYDIQFEFASGGGKLTRTFPADKTGSFDLEIEQTATPLGTFTVSP